MKTAYELAMERLNKSAPMTKLTEAQKKEIAELDSKYAAKVAEREIVMKAEIDQAAGAGDWEKVESLKQQLSNERKKMQSDLEEKKEQVRQAKKRS
jgi:septin family protein